MKAELKAVADSATDKEIAAKARSLIAVLNQEHPVLKKEELQKIARINYKFHPEQEQFLVLLVPKKVDMNMLKFEIINFNTDQYPQREFTVLVNQDAMQDTALVIVKPLGQLKEARKYETAFNTYPALLNLLIKHGIKVYLFSQDNFEEFLRIKSSDAYRIFYKKYYLR